MNYFVLSDIHGCLHELKVMMTQWNPDKEKLVFLGDAVDRGADSYGVIRYLKNLEEQHGDKVVILQGNHDNEFTSWLAMGELAGIYYNTMHDDTIKSFYRAKGREMQKDTRQQRASFLLHNFRKEISFLRHLPLYHETENLLFVHAGIDYTVADWRQSGPGTLLWIRNAFFDSEATIDKRVVFGHTPTRYLNEDKSNRIWVSREGDKVGVDGGCVFGGQLNAVVFNEKGDILKGMSVPKGSAKVHYYTKGEIE